MNLYLVERNDDRLLYDANEAHVIAATTESNALQAARAVSCDEGIAAWDGAIITNIGECSIDVDDQHIILTSFNAG